MVTLQVEVFCTSDSISNKDLSHVMGLGCCGIAVDDVLQLARKDLANSVTCKTCCLLRG